MRKGQESVYDKWSISVVICDTGIPLTNIMFLNTPYLKTAGLINYVSHRD